MLQKSLLAVIALFFVIHFTNAQISTPQPSPLSTVEQVVGLTNISVTYSRPSMKGRAIFGDLVPFDKMWRTGANASTKIKFDKPISIEKTNLEAGEYALYMIPSKDEWTVIFHKNTSYWGTGGADYKEAEDALRFKVKPTKLTNKIETLFIGFENLTRTSAEFSLKWENTAIYFKIDTDTDAEIEKQIERFSQNPEASLANSYYQSASYYLEKGKNLDKALEWAKKATQIRPDAYWMLRTQALIQAAQKDYKGAIMTLKKSSEKAQEGGNEGYVEMNKKSLAAWMKLK